MKACKKSGRIHSLESFGTHEGPGIRYVVFLQGCLARCLYCQNPDTWSLRSGKLISAAEVFDKISKCLPYIYSSKGGVTVSGGEPLLQADFLVELFKICKQADKENPVHTAIDTSAFYSFKPPVNKAIKSLIKLTDLFIVDLKAAIPELHKKITSRDLKEVIFFISFLERNKKPYWIRYVLVPGLNDAPEQLKKLKALIEGLKYMEKFEFLPYHTLGSHKWAHMGLKYPLLGIRPANPKDIKKALDILHSSKVLN